jgi:hypothetical protein
MIERAGMAMTDNQFPLGQRVNLPEHSRSSPPGDRFPTRLCWRPFRGIDAQIAHGSSFHNERSPDPKREYGQRERRLGTAASTTSLDGIAGFMLVNGSRSSTQPRETGDMIARTRELARLANRGSGESAA